MAERSLLKTTILPLAIDETNDTVLTIIWVGLNMTLVIVYVKELPLQN